MSAGRLPLPTSPMTIRTSEEEERERINRLESEETLALGPPALLDLDDHRGQPQSIARTGSIGRAQGRRGTIDSIVKEKPDFLSPENPIARDFETAITDDEENGVSDQVASPANRKNTFSRRYRTKSRGSSRSSDSSAPNSVHAFAERTRRRRAGTVNSKPGSIKNSLRRTLSGGTHRRRPTVTELQDDASPQEADQDVCYPQSEEEEGEDIDFEELEEFIAENETERPVVESILPKISTVPPTPERKVSDAVLSDDDLKDLEKHARPQSPPSRRASQVEADIKKRWWTFFSSDFDDAIYSSTIGGLLEPGETFQNLFQLQQDGGCWWLDALNPTEEEVTALCKAFGVHPLTREDIVTQESREKVELFKKYYFVSFRSFNPDKNSEDFLDPVNVYAVVFRQGLLTFSFMPEKNPHPKNVLKRIGKLRDYMQLSADWICYALIDDIVDSFTPFVHGIETEVDTIEDSVYISRPEDAREVLRSIANCRKKVLSLLRLLGGKSDVIKGFAKRCNEGFEAAPRGDVGLYLSDIQDHVLTMRDNLAHSEQLLSRVHTNYLAQVNVDNISHGNSVNKILSKITLLASILVPLNLVTGLFGMNVAVPGKDDDSLAWFFGIVGCLVAFVVIACGIARKYKFI